MKQIVILLLMLVASLCYSKSLPEEDSVVSVYTTQPTTSGTGLDIYQQIATNIAEKISSPFYRLFRVQKNKTEDQPTTKKLWEKIELLDEPEPTKYKEDNNIEHRDVEELTNEVFKKSDKKPEKVTLYNGYLPALRMSQNIEEVQNDTMNEIDADFDDNFFTLDDVDEPKPRQGPLIFMLELFGSFFQLLWGVIESIFGSSSSSTAQTPENTQ